MAKSIGETMDSDLAITIILKICSEVFQLEQRILSAMNNGQSRRSFCRYMECLVDHWGEPEQTLV